MALLSERKKNKFVFNLLMSIYSNLNKNQNTSIEMSHTKTMTRIETYKYFYTIAKQFPLGDLQRNMNLAGFDIGQEFKTRFGTITNYKDFIRILDIGDILLGTYPVKRNHNKTEINEDKTICLLHDAIFSKNSQNNCTELCLPFVVGLLKGLGFNDSSIKTYRQPNNDVCCNRSMISNHFLNL